MSLSVLAGGIDNRTNWSVEYVRTLNRNAATDSADAVAYNPAGVMKMGDGLYGNLSVHMIDKNYSNNVNGQDLDSRKPSYIPGLFALYKQERWAVMAALSNYGGGGKVDFDNGSWTTQKAGLGIISQANAQLDAAAALLPVPPALLYYTAITDQILKAESLYLGYTFGGALKINKMISVSLGVRYIAADRKVDGSLNVSAANSAAGTIPGVNNDITANIDFDQEANGWGGILGLNISPLEKLNIGIRYETETELNFETTVKNDNLGLLPQIGVFDNTLANRNLPATFALGVSYRFTPRIRVETDLTWYFNQSADWEGFQNQVTDGYDLGIGLMYAITKNLEASLGFLYTNTGMDAEDMTPEAPELDAKTIGAGFAWSLRNNLTLNFALGNVFYDSDGFTDLATGMRVKYEKNNFFLAFGIQYKFL
jgi:long-chain fatty acid transport protein